MCTCVCGLPCTFHFLPKASDWPTSARCPAKGALAEIQTESCHSSRFDHFLYAHLVFRASKMQMTANAALHPDICTSQARGGIITGFKGPQAYWRLCLTSGVWVETLQIQHFAHDYHAYVSPCLPSPTSWDSMKTVLLFYNASALVISTMKRRVRKKIHSTIIIMLRCESSKFKALKEAGVGNYKLSQAAVNQSNEIVSSWNK